MEIYSGKQAGEISKMMLAYAAYDFLKIHLKADIQYNFNGICNNSHERQNRERGVQEAKEIYESVTPPIIRGILEMSVMAIDLINKKRY